MRWDIIGELVDGDDEDLPFSRNIHHHAFLDGSGDEMDLFEYIFRYT